MRLYSRRYEFFCRIFTFLLISGLRCGLQSNGRAGPAMRIPISRRNRYKVLLKVLKLPEDLLIAALCDEEVRD
jgi:hypothetical protein